MKIQYRIRQWALLGLTIVFSACNDDELEQFVAGIRTAVLSDVTETTAVCGMKVEGELAGVDEMGLCWGKTPNPTVDGNKKSVELEGGEYAVSLDGLRSGTLYFVRSYLKSGSQVKYGDMRSFTTLGQLAYPLPYAERFRGEVFPSLHWSQIDADGDGHVWEFYARYPGALSLSYDDDALEPNNFLVSPKVEVTGGKVKLRWSVGVINKNYPGEYYKVLVAETPFTAENYAGHGTKVFEETLVAEGYRNLLSREVDLSAYSGKDVYVAWVHCESSDNDAMYFTDVEIVSAESPSVATLPQLTVDEAAGNGASGYDLSATVTDDGGLTVVEKGFCYAKTPSPTLSDGVIRLAGYEDFEAVLKELEGGENYYVRAFATNRVGTSYSKEVSFTASMRVVETLLTESFDTDFVGRWTLIDKDGDGYQWEYNSSKKRVESRSYNNGALTPENYLITPAIAIPAGADSLEITFKVADYNDTDYLDAYKLIISEVPITADNCRTATEIMPYTPLDTGDWVDKSHKFSLEGWAGKTVYIGLVHGNCTDQSRILVDDIVISAITGE